MNKRTDQTKSHYEPRLAIYDEGYAIHDWESRKTQRRRFDVLIEHAQLEGARILDVGCGVGDLYGYLTCENGFRIDYVGVDILESMVDTAQGRYADGTFLCADLIKANPFEERSFDVVYCSGTFNLAIGDHRCFAQTMLSVLVRLFERCLLFNMLDADSPKRDPRYCYFDPDCVIRWEVLNPFHPTLITGYLPNDFSIVCSHGPHTI